VLERRLRVRAGVVDMTIAKGDLWVAGFGAVSRIDPATGRLLARIAIAAVGDLSQIAAAGGSIWVTSADGVYRIDDATNRVVAAVDTGRGATLGITAGAGRIWVTRPGEGAGEVLAIDPRTNRVAGPPIAVGPGPARLAYGTGSAWVLDTAPLAVQRIDPATASATTPAALATASATTPTALATALSASSQAGAIAAGDGSLWVTSTDRLTRFDPSTGRVLATLRIARAGELAIAGTAAWVLGEPRSRSPTRFYPIKNTARLWQITPCATATAIVGPPFRLNLNEPIAVAAGSRYVWVAGFPDSLIELRLIPGASRRRC
jgi:hypothetical protein